MLSLIAFDGAYDIGLPLLALINVIVKESGWIKRRVFHLKGGWPSPLSITYFEYMVCHCFSFVFVTQNM